MVITIWKRHCWSCRPGYMPSNPVLMLRHHGQNDIESELHEVTPGTATLPADQTPPLWRPAHINPLPSLHLYKPSWPSIFNLIDVFKNPRIYYRDCQPANSQLYTFHHHIPSSTTQDPQDAHLHHSGRSPPLYSYSAGAGSPGCTFLHRLHVLRSHRNKRYATVSTVTTNAAIPSHASSDSPPSAEIAPAKRNVFKDVVDKADAMVGDLIDLKPGETSIYGPVQGTVGW